MLRMDRETEMIAAVLHDIVEDTAWEMVDLKEEGFSDDILKVIACLTRRKEETY
jgi:(p)ppGpp synthase/HD superfamily hydrolase